MGYSLKGHTELDTAERLSVHTYTSSSKPYEAKFSIPNLQMKKLNRLGVKSLAQGPHC